MTPKKKNSTQKNNLPELAELLTSLAGSGIELVSKGIKVAEKLAIKRSLFKKYGYLDQAFKNVKSVMKFMECSVNATGDVKNEGPRRKKSNKTVQKQKTVRHKR